MDYHKSIQDYSNTKFKLFNNVLPYEKTSVIFTDNDEGIKFFEKLKKLNRNIFDIGINAEKLKILSSENIATGHKVKILYNDKIFSFNFNLQAYFQISNALCAAGLAITSGANYKDVFSVIENIKPVYGRMNIIESKNNSKIIIDYAHTPDALLSVLQYANSLSKNVTLAFGCGGDRDVSKREIMGEIAEKFSDKVIITNDNPRYEDPSNIAKMIQKGCPSAQIIFNRKEAIEYGLSEANSGDIFIIAGKGHESYQIEKGKKTYFSDMDVVKNFLENANG
jgi:UDP-N-acetylmuramyl-tripeptide synthetase